MRARKFKGMVLVTGLLVAASSLAMDPVPSEWPLERIVANLEARLKETPDDEEAHYNLGRARAFAFALERSSLLVVDRNMSVPELDKQRHGNPLDLPPQTSSEKLEDLAQGVLHLRRACELDSKGAWWATRKHLTLAWLLETGAHLADRVDTLTLLDVKPAELAFAERQNFDRWIAELASSEPATVDNARKNLSAPENLERALPLLTLQTASPDAQRQKAVAGLFQRYWIERAIAEYWKAVDLGFGVDLSSDLGPRNEEEVHKLVSYEALESYGRLVQQRGVQGAIEERRLADGESMKKRLESMPRRLWGTPIVVSLDGCKSLDELVTPNLSVPFDLDGDGVDELWPWIAKDAGWLVWDPHHRGEITSGQQLFGSASAWLFFADGYRVLDALDDDRNGKLEGAELDGIAVWFDRNTNGVSDRGEVIPVQQLGIAALATHSTLTIGASPANLCGLEMNDGRVLPTYDWVLESKATP